MPADAPSSAGPDDVNATLARALPGSRSRFAAPLGGVIIVGVLCAVAWAMTGASPEHRSATGVPVPPIVLRDTVAGNRQLRAASDLLVAGRVTEARTRFTRIQSTGRGDVRRSALVGLILTDWNDRGPGAVRSKLVALADQPGMDRDGYVTLHVGIVDLLLNRTRLAKGELAEARSAALTARSFDVARRSDDLLHPQLPTGYPPIVVDPGGLAGQAAVRARALRDLVIAGDRHGARLQADSALTADGNPLVRSMALAARFDKSAPSRDLPALAALGMRSDLRLQLALVELWSGRRAAAMVEMRRLAQRPVRSQLDRAVARIAQRVLVAR